MTRYSNCLEYFDRMSITSIFENASVSMKPRTWKIPTQKRNDKRPSKSKHNNFSSISCDGRTRKSPFSKAAVDFICYWKVKRFVKREMEKHVINDCKHGTAILDKLFTTREKLSPHYWKNALTSKSNLTTESSNMQTFTVTLCRFALDPPAILESCSPSSYRRDILLELWARSTHEKHLKQAFSPEKPL